MKHFSITMIIVVALMLALPSSVHAQQKNTVSAVTKTEPSHETLELELAKKDQTIAELKREIVQAQRQILDLQIQNLAFVARDVEAEKKAADSTVEEKQKKAPAKK